jgi:hypothetical protein
MDWAWLESMARSECEEKEEQVQLKQLEGRGDFHQFKGLENGGSE